MPGLLVANGIPASLRAGLCAIVSVLLLATACASDPLSSDVNTVAGSIGIESATAVVTTPPLLVPPAAVADTATSASTPPPVIVAFVEPAADQTAEPGSASADTERPSVPVGTASAAAPSAQPVPEPVATVVPAAEPTPTSVPPTVLPTPTATPQEPTPQPTSTAPPSTPVPTATPTATPSAAAARNVTATGLRPLGRVGTINLSLPVGLIEIIGFHEAGHPGSKAINAAGTGVEMMTLASRSRGTAPRSAADIVVPPGEPVFAPASGTVVSAGSYVLYCEHEDSLVYIEPDGFPGWQVRVFHVSGTLPQVGSRVVGGVTRIADGARVLPFESQVDEFTSEPSWPHVHIEVVDTTVADDRPAGPGCD